MFVFRSDKNVNVERLKYGMIGKYIDVNYNKM